MMTRIFICWRFDWEAGRRLVCDFISQLRCSKETTVYSYVCNIMNIRIYLALIPSCFEMSVRLKSKGPVHFCAKGPRIKVSKDDLLGWRRRSKGEMCCFFILSDSETSSHSHSWCSLCWSQLMRVSHTHAQPAHKHKSPSPPTLL